jgi:hypothetical protein
MAARNEDDFDVLKFFIAVMVLLTAFVGCYAFYLRSQVLQLSTQIQTQVRTFEEMRKVADDAPFREWIARERESHQGDRGSSVTDFKALLVQAAPDFHLNYVQLPSQEGMQDYRVAQEIPFRMSFDGCRIEDLVRFLAHVEEKWPGAKTREIQQLEFDEKKQTWKTSLVVSIFKSTT